MPELAGAPNNSITVHRSCPLCGSNRPQHYLSTKDVVFGFPGDFDVVRCRDCGMLYTNPQIAPHELYRFYPQNYNAHHERCSSTDRLRTKDVWDRLPLIGQGRLLDIGCGSGDYLLRQQLRGWKVLGIEPSPQAVAVARGRGLDVQQGSILEADLANREFDVITLLGVLDHLPEPRSALSHLRGLLDPRGLLIASVPNAASAAAGVFGQDWPAWDLPRHQNHFTPNTLKGMLIASGFGCVRIQGRRRAARWRQGARIMQSSDRRRRWSLLARSRFLCSAASFLLSGKTRQDEMIAIARLA